MMKVITSEGHGWQIFLCSEVHKNLSYVYPNYSQIYSLFTYLPMKVERTECSKMSGYKIQTPGNYPEENIQHENSSRVLQFS
jgi:hypothetical protein